MSGHIPPSRGRWPKIHPGAVVGGAVIADVDKSRVGNKIRVGAGIDLQDRTIAQDNRDWAEAAALSAKKDERGSQAVR
ncbi:MAG: hypothetical protein RH942_15010 [Kiloniellaceae bacterium]